ncbi:hypothetical protein [Permianibacter aggregans]|uniref:Uncharacterized protein n=1 Tax=Permianibacter aggregans TaxID=1510150 RepID=A0A4R6USG2_9GAMM|nr:hypothetical protein [Permianibacter aggregans]QGX38409.1 hypothetical protein E2H98_01500 [Permianibacter aggregans]TDQ48739.1 hypothetical protein EV696_106180 [Permianibacter aggregans]
MNDLSVALPEWAEFYSVLLQVSATFAGLLFVNLSLRYELLNRDEYASAKRFARQTFRAFLSLVIFSLILLVPRSGSYGVSIPMFLVGLYALITMLMSMRADLRESASSIRMGRSRRIYVFSILTYLMFIAVSCLLYFGWARSLYLVVGLVIWNLALGTASTWNSLVELKTDRAGK